MPDPTDKAPPESPIAAVFGRMLHEAMTKLPLDDRLDAVGFVLGWATSFGYAELLSLSRQSVAAGNPPLDARGVMQQIHADMLERAARQARALGLEPPSA